MCVEAFENGKKLNDKVVCNEKICNFVLHFFSYNLRIYAENSNNLVCVMKEKRYSTTSSEFLERAIEITEIFT